MKQVGVFIQEIFSCERFSKINRSERADRTFKNVKFQKINNKALNYFYYYNFFIFLLTTISEMKKYIFLLFFTIILLHPCLLLAQGGPGPNDDFCPCCEENFAPDSVEYNNCLNSCVPSAPGTICDNLVPVDSPVLLLLIAGTSLGFVFINRTAKKRRLKN